MSNDKPLYCGGMVDGTECEACYFEPMLGRWIARVPSATRAEWVEVLVHICPYCGTALGVTPDGQPTRGPRILRPLLDIETYFEAALLEAMAQGEGGSYAAALGRVSCAFGSWLVGDFVELERLPPGITNRLEVSDEQ